jgi:hypothetical protein
MQIITLAFKYLVWFNRYHQVEVTTLAPTITRAAFTRNPYSRPVSNSGRNFDLKTLLAGYSADTPAYRTGHVSDITATSAARASFFNLKTKNTAGPVISFLQSYLNRMLYILSSPRASSMTGCLSTESTKQVTK